MTVQHDRRRFLRVKLALLLCVAFGLSGCGKTPKGNVSGTVTYKGQALPAGTVVFYGAGGQVASGAIEPNGSYTVANVPVGQAKITVTTPPPLPESASQGVPGSDKGTPNSVQIPEDYGAPDKSGLSYEVTAGDQQHPIELK